jgi:hypothetical protein
MPALQTTRESTDENEREPIDAVEVFEVSFAQSHVTRQCLPVLVIE